MNPGRLDTKVSIMQPSESIGALGDRGEAGSFTELVTRSAEVKHLRGAELDKAQSLVPEVQTKITVRHDSQTKLIKADWRVHYGADVFHIMHVLPVPGGARPTRLELYCRLNG